MDFIIDGFIKAFFLLIHLDPATMSAISATLKVSTIAILISLVLGLPLGFALGYFTFPGKRHIKTLVDTLLALPTVCIGLIIYALISSQGPLGEWNLLFTLTGIAMGLTVLALPIVIAITAATVENIELRCKSHNQLAAEQDYGGASMSRYWAPSVREVRLDYRVSKLRVTGSGGSAGPLPHEVAPVGSSGARFAVRA